jgi:ribosomal protein L22
MVTQTEVNPAEVMSADKNGQKEKKTTKKEEKVEVPKTETPRVEVKKEKISKDIAIVNGFSLTISTKHSSFIGKMVMRKPIDRAIEMLELVLKKKMAVPMTSLEIPHKKRSLMPGHVGGGGRFPANASKEVIHLLKQLKANCDSNNVENPVITLFVANLASRPYRRDRTRGKRTHIHIEARDKTKLIMKKHK